MLDCLYSLPKITYELAFSSLFRAVSSKLSGCLPGYSPQQDPEYNLNSQLMLCIFQIQLDSSGAFLTLPLDLMLPGNLKTAQDLLSIRSVIKFCSVAYYATFLTSLNFTFSICNGGIMIALNLGQGAAQNVDLSIPGWESCRREAPWEPLKNSGRRVSWFLSPKPTFWRLPSHIISLLLFPSYTQAYFFTPLPFIYPTPRLQWGAKQHSKWVRILIRIESRRLEPKAPRAGEGRRLDS